MNVVGLDGKEYKWNLSRYKPKKRVSKPHLKCRELLKEIFPCHTIIEEATLPGSGKPPLYSDFFIPHLNLMVEVHGEQHYTYNTFHFKDKKDFILAQARDRRKAEWCEINNIELIVLDHKEYDKWREQING